jgi:hypothetical protein
MGRFEIAETDHVAIYAGISHEVYVTNEMRGEVVTCTVAFQTDRDGYMVFKADAAVFKSGECRVARVHGQ